MTLFKATIYVGSQLQVFCTVLSTAPCATYLQSCILRLDLAQCPCWGPPSTPGKKIVIHGTRLQLTAGVPAGGGQMWHVGGCRGR
jgi:hypothetical protein